MKEIASYRWFFNGIASHVFAMSDGVSRFVLFDDSSYEGVHFDCECALMHAFIAKVNEVTNLQSKIFYNAVES